MFLFCDFERSFLQIHSPHLSCFGYARLLRRQLRSHNRITSCFTSLQYNIRYLNNLSLVGISHSNSFIFFFLFSLSLSLSLSLSCTHSFTCLTFNKIRIYVTTFGKHIKYERYLSHLWPERHVAHFMIFCRIENNCDFSLRRINNFLVINS